LLANIIHFSEKVKEEPFEQKGDFFVTSTHEKRYNQRDERI